MHLHMRLRQCTQILITMDDFDDLGNCYGYICVSSIPQRKFTGSEWTMTYKAAHCIRNRFFSLEWFSALRSNKILASLLRPDCVCICILIGSKDNFPMASAVSAASKIKWVTCNIHKRFTMHLYLQFMCNCHESTGRQQKEYAFWNGGSN